MAHRRRQFSIFKFALAFLAVGPAPVNTPLNLLAQSAPKRHSVLNKAAGDRMTILIVDDDPVQCRLLEGMLQKFDYEVMVRDFRRRRAGVAHRP